MKSIKEKSEDLYPDKKVVLARGNTCLSCGRVKRESFEAGANYVLGEIDEFMQDNPHVNFESYKAIKDKIAQLKK